MERGIKDEGFVRKALDDAKSDDGRWIANQACFNGASDAMLDATARAALVTAVAIYKEHHKLQDDHLKAALDVTTVGEARALIDQLSPLVA